MAVIKYFYILLICLFHLNFESLAEFICPPEVLGFLPPRLQQRPSPIRPPYQAV